MASSSSSASKRAQELRRCVACFSLFTLVASFMLYLVALCTSHGPLQLAITQTETTRRHIRPSSTSIEFDCIGSSQIGPVVAHHKVEKVRYPFFISIADLGTLEKPNRNFQRILKGKLFQKPAISETVQIILEKLKTSVFAKGRSSVVDVGANVGMATFAAAAMGYTVFAFEPVLENVHKLCDGVYLNRVSSLVNLYHLAVSDSPGSTTMHKVVGRLDNSAVSATGANLAFPSLSDLFHWILCFHHQALYCY